MTAPPGHSARAAVTIRLCTADDLQALEWDGLFAAHREIITTAFARQLAGTNVMLVAANTDRTVGQVWIDLERGAAGGALLWALRVHASVQGRGIGTALLDAAEAWLVAHGFQSVSIGVEKPNTQALRLYCRRGFRIGGTVVERYSFTPPDGVHTEVIVDQWLLQKSLRAPAGGR
jgi:ribosomal protein S18 acetylase RimI-like enzyme